MVNLEWFRTFKTIYEKGSLTAAAKELNVSQPGVSLHIDSLESYVGNKLFDRGSRKMIPTEHGKIIYNSTVEAINKLEQAEKHFSKNSNNKITSISIGMCFETFQFVLEPYISELPFNLISKFGDYKEMLNDLDKGLLDLVITPQINTNLNLEYSQFSKEKIVLLAGCKTQTKEVEDLIRNKKFEDCENWLAQQTWFGTNGDMEHLRLFWQLNFKKRPTFKPNYIVPNISSIIRCISNSKGWAVIPDFLAEKEIRDNKIKLVWDGKIPLENSLSFAQRKKTIYDKELKIIKEIFKQNMK